MNIPMGNQPQITVAPRCPHCGSLNCATYRSQGIAAGIEHNGQRYRAQKQYRRCRECGEGFGVVHIKDMMTPRRRRRP